METGNRNVEGVTGILYLGDSIFKILCRCYLYTYHKHVYLMRPKSDNQNQVYPYYSGNLTCIIPNFNQLL